MRCRERWGVTTRLESHWRCYGACCRSQDYERLAAQLDGARARLAKRVQDFAWVDSKIPLVEEAERHAELLDALAMNLTR